MDYMHDLPLYPHFPSGYDHVLVPSVPRLKSHHLFLTVEPLDRDLFPPFNNATTTVPSDGFSFLVEDVRNCLINQPERG
jgi:hypothetical protein